jgi:hypothetical protein
VEDGPSPRAASQCASNRIKPCSLRLIASAGSPLPPLSSLTGSSQSSVSSVRSFQIVVDEVISAPAHSNLLRVRSVPAFLPLADHSEASPVCFVRSQIHATSYLIHAWPTRTDELLKVKPAVDAFEEAMVPILREKDIPSHSLHWGVLLGQPRQPPRRERQVLRSHLAELLHVHIRHVGMIFIGSINRVSVISHTYSRS